MSHRSEGLRDTGGVGEVDSLEDRVKECPLGYRNRTRRAIALEEHAEPMVPNLTQARAAILRANALYKSTKLPILTKSPTQEQPLRRRGSSRSS